MSVVVTSEFLVWTAVLFKKQSMFLYFIKKIKETKFCSRKIKKAKLKKTNFIIKTFVAMFFNKFKTTL